jgi:stearoyl-CoA desaturase (delta-9 desaturase)
MTKTPTTANGASPGPVAPSPRAPWWTVILRWFDNETNPRIAASTAPHRIDWARCVPFISIHLMCLGVVWVGWSPFAVGMAALLYALRMVAVTGFYHRYFSHRSFKTSRATQFVLALLGATAAQRGPLWWSSHHRHHHAHADAEQDAHSPRRHGFWWSHLGWFLAPQTFHARIERVPDWRRYPELRLLDRFDIVVPVLLASTLYAAGAWLEHAAPGLQTDGLQLLVWGFFVSTVVLYHATYTINSLAHRFGRRRYRTGDDSRNSFLLALLTFGEGWHNNHHHFPASTRQGFYWWEIDLTYYVLRMLAALGVIWDLRPVPDHVRDARRIGQETIR